MKAMVVESNMLTYPNLNKPFVMYTNASDYAMGGIVTQGWNIISLFSKKFNMANKLPSRYS